MQRSDVSRLFCAGLFVALLGCDGTGGSAVDAAATDAGTATDADVRADRDGGPRVDAGEVDDELTSLPADTGGTHTAHPLGSTAAAFGYYVYLPGGYDTSSLHYPLLVFLHGKGERGDGDAQLNRLLNTGIPRMIDRDAWHPTYPMIVVSPQYENPDGVGNDNNWGEGHPEELRGFIEHVIATYRVNSHRIYLTGLSHGGNGVYDYLILEDDATSYVAAAAPIAAWGPNRGYEHSAHTPIWVFVGANDTSNFNTSRNFITGYNAQDPAPAHTARFTVYPGAGHDVWTRTYDLSGMGTEDAMYDAYDVGIFDWMFNYRRD